MRPALPLLRALPQPLVAPVSIAVGPEGGLEADERSLVIGSGFVPVSLGDTILRFETAGVAALAAIRAALSAAAAPTPWMVAQREESMPTPDPCVFCRILRGEIPAQFVYETPDVVAFRDINPQAPYHVVVIPREHVTTLNDASDGAVAGRLVSAAVALAKRDGYADRGYRTVINTNGDGGQTVYHLHLHLLAGRHMGWPPG